MSNKRTTLSIVLILTAAFMLMLLDGRFRTEVSDRIESADIIEMSTSSGGLFSSKKDWVPNETLTGNFLAGNFAQARRDWALTNSYLERMGDPQDMDPETRLRMMLLAIGAGKFDRAIDYARIVKNLATEESGIVFQGAFGDGTDLASLVLLAQSVRSGDVKSAAELLKTLKSPPLVAFVEPVINSWLQAGLSKNLSTASGDLSLLQALHRGLAAEWGKQKEVSNSVFDALNKASLTPAGAMMVAAYNIRNARMDQARAALSEALRQNPENQDTKTILEALNQGQSPVLKNDLSYHLKGVSAGVALAMKDLAQMMMGDQALDSALIFAQLGHMIRDDVPGLKILVGSIYIDQERWDDAIKILDSIDSSSDDFSNAQIRLSELYGERGDLKRSEKILKDLITSNPEPHVAYALGEFYRREKDYDKAVKAYDRTVELSGGKVDDSLWSVYYVRAMAYDELDQWEKAERDLKTALKYRPENPHVLNYLGYSWADRNINLTQSRDMIIRALSQAPVDPYITDSLGWVYFRQGDLKQATILLERAVSLKPYDPVLNDHLGDVYDKVGRKLEARYQWRRALDYADPVRDAALIEEIKKKLQ